MDHRWTLPALLGIVLAAPGNLPASDAQAGSVDFSRDIRPILSKNCYACHGPDNAKRATKMRLDQRDSAVRRLASGGAAIVPGLPEKSEIVQRITSNDDAERMPPKDTGHELTPGQVSSLKRWIAKGAAYADHWAFAAPQPRPVPSVRQASWPRNDLDRWVVARLEGEGLSPSPEADRHTLLRRASLDLRGLPPSIHEVREFIDDAMPGAYERAVDRFLNDPAYGERWARMWLDLARYADSAGYGSDPLRTIWRYRDWVIDAFNRNLPYDQFTIEQLAGDLLPNATLEQRIATAFHRNTMTNTEGGTDDEEFRVAAVKDRVDTTSQVWMAVTMGCAKCHNHKYEPITQHEYYRFYAIFNQTEDADRPDEQPVLTAPTREQQLALQTIDERIAALKHRLEQPGIEQIAMQVLLRSRLTPQTAEVIGAMTQLARSRPQVATVPVMVALPAAKQRQTLLMRKGNFRDPGDSVEPGVPAALSPRIETARPDRLAVARWLMNPQNPLTARVAVNRLWAQLWGTGLVETEEDFGSQGELPSHPELLDWLALEYQRLGWDTKALLRLLVTSATYRQSSRIAPDRLARDPRNRLFTRGPRFRLDAETVRDQALAVSGLLSRKSHGPSVYPPQPPGLWQAAFNGQRTWATSLGEDRYRRGLYIFWRRTIPYPSMATFDAPSRETCSVRRIRTNTPLQALVTLNDPVYVEAAQALARRIYREAGPAAEDRARFGLAVALARPPAQTEVARLLTLYLETRRSFTSDPKAALAIATEPLGPLPPGYVAEELAAWTVVANVLLNLDGVLTKG